MDVRSTAGMILVTLLALCPACSKEAVVDLFADKVEEVAGPEVATALRQQATDQIGQVMAPVDAGCEQAVVAVGQELGRTIEDRLARIYPDGIPEGAVAELADAALALGQRPGGDLSPVTIDAVAGVERIDRALADVQEYRDELGASDPRTAAALEELIRELSRSWAEQLPGRMAGSDCAPRLAALEALAGDFAAAVSPEASFPATQP